MKSSCWGLTKLTVSGINDLSSKGNYMSLNLQDQLSENRIIPIYVGSGIDSQTLNQKVLNCISGEQWLDRLCTDTIGASCFAYNTVRSRKGKTGDHSSVSAVLPTQMT